MARYSSIPTISFPTSNPSSTSGTTPRRYTKVKYPEISLDFSDIYVYTTRGDRYDTLALTYYLDPSLWWIIARANVKTQSMDSLIPDFGAQIRIPASTRISSIIAEYDTLNRSI
jgi:hypothetical protein